MKQLFNLNKLVDNDHFFSLEIQLHICSCHRCEQMIEKNDLMVIYKLSKSITLKRRDT